VRELCSTEAVSTLLLTATFEVIAMDFEDRLKKLQSLFTYSLSNSVTAKARYIAIVDDPSATSAAIALAKMNWQQLEARKTAIIAEMVRLEELEIETA
jgi:hypothetical protein